MSWSASASPGHRRNSARSNKATFLSTKSVLECPAHAFAYSWEGANPGCRGHEQSIADWEVGEACHSWEQGGYDVVGAVREKWLSFMCDERRETMVFVGDQHLHPGAFMVLGTFYPEYRLDVGQLRLDLAA